MAILATGRRERMMSQKKPMNVGVLVPCRNESQVIERKLRNLVQLERRGQAMALKIVVVDDHSTDDTLTRANACLAQLQPDALEIELISNRVRPGKNGAIECGLAHLGSDVDVVILTDADVVVGEDAVSKVCDAFRHDDELGMVCATQVFVERLPENGLAREARSVALADDRWDRMTRAVRRLESRFGMLFSVHGQWLAWRADLGLVPAPRVAADDVDLMIQVRSSARPRVRMLPDVLFYECKPVAGEALDVQALRRARAWFQVFARPGVLHDWRGVSAIQGQAYRFLPGAAPMLAIVGMLFAVLFAFAAWGAWGALAVIAILVALVLSPAGRAWSRTLRLIHRAARLERQGAMGEAWEMTRE